MTRVTFIPQNDEQAVYAVCDDFTIVRVGKPSTDHDRIFARYNRLDRAQFYGARRFTIGGRIVRHFCVRSTADPQYAGAIPVPVKDVRLVPDRPHRVVIDGGYGRFRAFVVTKDGIATSSGTHTGPARWPSDGTAPTFHRDAFKATTAARSAARRRNLI